MIGHYLTADKMRECYKQADEWDDAKLRHLSNKLVHTETQAQRQRQQEEMYKFDGWQQQG